MNHVPVMRIEAVALLNVKPAGIYVDATLGDGGHARMIAEKLIQGKLIGIDTDSGAVARASEALRAFGGTVILKKGNFSSFDSVLKSLRLKKIDGILFDLGVSSMQLEDAARGFSFRRDGPLDMRMDRDTRLTAEEVVNDYPGEELERIISAYGEEPAARRVAVAITSARARGRIKTTVELAKIVRTAVHARGRLFAVPRQRGRLDPATRTFQAIRIEVNSELSSLPAALAKLPGMMKKRGRVVVLSYHSLEDRIVKRFFKEHRSVFRMLTKKPLRPSETEVEENPRSRSAKLRAAERI
jgi:16S rRNA (cytosine1402-N4)-methyltransferase